MKNKKKGEEKLNMKKKNKLILGTAGLALSLMALGAGMYGLNGQSKTASADTVATSPYCLTYGVTTLDGTRMAGSPEHFNVYMKSSRSSGSATVYNGHITNFSQYYFTVDAVNVAAHVSFELYKDGKVEQKVEVSGNADFTTNFGALSSGDYMLKYNCFCKGSGIAVKECVYEYSFEVDVTDPTYSLSAGTGSGSYYTNRNVVYSAGDVNFNCIRYRRGSENTFSYYYDDSITIEATEENNGYWYFYALDTVGNQSTIVNRYIDTIAPVGTVTNQDEDTVENGGATSAAFIYSATDAGGVWYMEYKKPGSTAWERYPANTGITGTEGLYVFRAIDCAGNVSDEYRVYFDRTAPLGCVFDAGSARGSGSITNKSYVKYVATDTGSGIASVYVQKPGSSTFTAYANGAELTTEGKYRFKAYDAAGNVTATTHEVTLDTSAPTGYVYADDVYPTSELYTSAAGICFEALDSVSEEVVCYVKKPGDADFEEYTAMTRLNEEGEYQFFAVDEVGNRSSIYSIVVLREAPTVQLYIDGQPANNNIGYTNGKNISFVFDKGTGYIIANGGSIERYVSGTTYTKEGRYAMAVEYMDWQVSCTVVIDRAPQKLTLTNVSGEYAWDSVDVSWADTDANVEAPIDTITVNEKLYKGGTLYVLDGCEYEIVCTDKAGNVWSKSFKAVKTNIPTITLQKVYWEVKDGWSDSIYSFSEYENAMIYATTAERRFIECKTWAAATWDQGIPMDTKDSVNAKNGIYYIYKSEEDPDKRVAYFTEERLNEVVQKYTEPTISAWYYWEKEPNPCLDGELNAYSKENKVVAPEVVLSEGYIYTLDGLEYTGLTITKPGAHTLVMEDGYGNSAEYEIYILRSVPTIYYALGDNTPTKAEYDRTYYFNGKVTVSIPFEGDEFAMFIVYDEQGDELGYFDISNACYIEKSGVYSAMAVNHYGETEEFKFVVSMNAPTISVSENADKKNLEIAVANSVDKQSHITYLEISKSVDGGVTWKTLAKDDYGKTITIENLKYSFRTSGIYKVVVMDEFRTGIDAVTYTVEYAQAKPVGALYGVEPNGATNGTVTFIWTDEAVVTLMKNGVAMNYMSGQELTEDGVYVLTFANHDGDEQVYVFTIDKTAPTILLNGVENGGSTKGSVSITDLSERATVVVSKDGKIIEYNLGDELKGVGRYAITVTDESGNVSNYSFEIVKGASAWAVVGIVAACVAVLGGVVVLILKKRGVL